MKLFANIFETVNYMSFCPACLCRRDLHVSIGPEYLFKKQQANFIYGEYNYNNSINCSIDFTSSIVSLSNKDNAMGLFIFYGANCQHSIEIMISENNYFHITDGAIPKEPNLFMWLESQCKNCDLRIYSVSSDIEFDTFSQKISPIAMEMDVIHVDDLEIDFSYINDNVRFHLKKEVLTVPMWDEDFNNINKLRKRIKTILTFG